MDVQSELKKRAQTFNTFWQRYLQNGEPATLYHAVRHLPLGGGKRIRPVMSMITCESVGGSSKKTYPFGAALELMHNFTLVHDDIMDKSTLRRNIPTVHIRFGEPTAILAGDFLFARSFEALHDLKVPCSLFQHLEKQLIRCVLDICEGQELDVEFEKQKIITENQYRGMIAKKTGVLFELAAGGGAMIGGGNTKEVNGLKNYGMALGLAFQIWDDYLDMSSDETTLGKDIGNDIRNGKKTLIAVHSLEHATGKQKQLLDSVFGNRTASNEEVKKVFRLFQQLGSIEYARKTALAYNRKAKDALRVLKNTEAKTLLQDLVDFSIQRNK